jgi:hypothetical protein
MGNNFYTPWINKPTPGFTEFEATSMNPALAGLDRGITYVKNVIVHCDGVVTYNALTGLLAWSGTLRILFNRADGQAIQNTVAAGNRTLADNQFAYVDLNETNDSVLTVSAASVSTGAASNFLAFNRLVLGYRNAASDQYFPVYLKAEPGVQLLTSAAEVTVDWSKGKTAKIILGHDVEFIFAGAIDGDRLVLRLTQDGVGGREPSWPASIRYSTDLPAIEIDTDIDAQAYLGFIFDSDVARYDLVSSAKSFGEFESS